MSFWPLFAWQELGEYWFVFAHCPEFYGSGLLLNKVGFSHQCAQPRDPGTHIVAMVAATRCHIFFPHQLLRCSQQAQLTL